MRFDGNGSEMQILLCHVVYIYRSIRMIRPPGNVDELF